MNPASSCTPISSRFQSSDLNPACLLSRRNFCTKPPASGTVRPLVNRADLQGQPSTDQTCKTHVPDHHGGGLRLETKNSRTP